MIMIIYFNKKINQINKLINKYQLEGNLSDKNKSSHHQFQHQSHQHLSNPIEFKEGKKILRNSKKSFRF